MRALGRPFDAVCACERMLLHVYVCMCVCVCVCAPVRICVFGSKYCVKCIAQRYSLTHLSSPDLPSIHHWKPPYLRLNTSPFTATCVYSLSFHPQPRQCQTENISQTLPVWRTGPGSAPHRPRQSNITYFTLSGQEAFVELLAR